MSFSVYPSHNESLGQQNAMARRPCEGVDSILRVNQFLLVSQSMVWRVG